jgi:cbb3-type cytochrome oxidase maturation protein
VDGLGDRATNEEDLMSAVGFLLPIAIILGAIFAVLFVLAVKNGQFDDLDDPPERMLKDD